MPDFLDKAKDLAQEHEDQVDAALDKVADLVDQKTGGGHQAQIEQGVEKVKDLLDGPGSAGKELHFDAKKGKKPG